MKNKLYWIWLSILNLSYKDKKTLLKIFKEPKEIYKTTKKELEKIISNQELVELILSQDIKKEAKYILKESEKENIKIITLNDIEYPKKLKEIEDKPLVLYTKGNYKLLNKENKIAHENVLNMERKLR